MYMIVQLNALGYSCNVYMCMFLSFHTKFIMLVIVNSPLYIFASACCLSVYCVCIRFYVTIVFFIPKMCKKNYSVFGSY
jgi:hypothetical protein